MEWFPLKTFFTTILAIICAFILIMGNIHWGNRTNIKAESKSMDIAVTHLESADEKQKAEIDEEQPQELLNLAANLPEQTRIQFEKALEQNKEFKILFVGSNSLGEGEQSWPKILEQKLLDAYGESILNFKTLIYDMTTQEFMDENKQEELAKEEADLILFEPFVLKDNGEVVVETSLEYVSNIIDYVKTIKPGTTFILQPPHPIYNAGFYTVQVRALEKFAQDNEIPYLNHWVVWPETSSEEIKNYLVTNPSGPNEKGHELWAEFLANFFIAEEN